MGLLPPIGVDFGGTSYIKSSTAARTRPEGLLQIQYFEAYPYYTVTLQSSTPQCTWH